MNQEEKNKIIKLQSEMLIRYINLTTEMVCDEEPQKAIITNKQELNRIYENKHLDDEEIDNLQKCDIAVKKLKINDIITLEVDEAFQDADIIKKMNLITAYNKRIKYDEKGVATNLAEVIKAISEKR